ncbi:MAG TPA: ATP-binding protein [Gemmataceae bacterium]|nr:ATP-binding protein [Gemmataceae bacterium]
MEAGEAAVHLPWLCPTTESLLVLAREPVELAWPSVRDDPGAILLILRHVQSSADAAHFIHEADQVALLGAAQRLLLETARSPIPSFIDNRHAGVRRVLRTGLSYARTARKLAERAANVDPDCAWVCGMLAPLGWLALAAVDPSKVQACLDDADFPDQAAEIQRERWSLDQDAIARRLLCRWETPQWVNAVVGRLALCKEIVEGLGSDLALFRTVQAAVLLVEQNGDGLQLSVATGIHEAIADLGLTSSDLKDIGVEQAPVPSSPRDTCRPPHLDPLLPEFLGLAADNYVLRQNKALESLEREQDQLHLLLQGGRQADTERLRALKLEALAEFAAGAAHEINNPLAVISGQAQYLLGHEAETARQQSLHKIITQVQRVHQLLTELMQFARPARPQRQWVEPHMLARETLLSLHEFATQRQVRLEGPQIEALPTIFVDARQSRTALECLVRNAIEAAGPGGWVRLRAQALADCLEFLIEDSGQGPNPAHAEHLFDPFFSGRQAGRGRGLGLPTAWRLAQEQGGDVRHAIVPGEPTRFVLTLPWGPQRDEATQVSATAPSNPLPRIATA